MHHTYAAYALFVGLADEAAEGIARLVAAQAVQVQLALDGPLALAQALQHVDADAGAAVAQGVVGLQQATGVEAVADGFHQHRLFVALQLDRQRRRLLYFQ